MPAVLVMSRVDMMAGWFFKGGEKKGVVMFLIVIANVHVYIMPGHEFQTASGMKSLNFCNRKIQYSLKWWPGCPCAVWTDSDTGTLPLLVTLILILVLFFCLQFTSSSPAAFRQRWVSAIYLKLLRSKHIKGSKEHYIYRDKIQHANFQGNPLDQLATKRHLNNS